MTATHVMTIHQHGSDKSYGQCSCSWGSDFLDEMALNRWILRHLTDVGYVVYEA